MKALGKRRADLLPNLPWATNITITEQKERANGSHIPLKRKRRAETKAKTEARVGAETLKLMLLLV